MLVTELATRLRRLGVKVVKKGDDALLVSFNGKQLRVEGPTVLDSDVNAIISTLVGRGYPLNFLKAYFGQKKMHPYIAHLFEQTIGSWSDTIEPLDAKRLKMPPRELVDGKTLLAYAIGDEVHIRLSTAIGEALKTIGLRETGPARSVLMDAIKDTDLYKPFQIEGGPGLRGKGERFVIRKGELETTFAKYVDELVELARGIFATSEVEVTSPDVVQAMATLIEAGIVTQEGGIDVQRFSRLVKEASRHAVPVVR